MEFWTNLQRISDLLLAEREIVRQLRLIPVLGVMPLECMRISYGEYWGEGEFVGGNMAAKSDAEIHAIAESAFLDVLVYPLSGSNFEARFRLVSSRHGRQETSYEIYLSGNLEQNHLGILNIAKSLIDERRQIFDERLSPASRLEYGHLVWNVCIEILYKKLVHALGGRRNFERFFSAADIQQYLPADSVRIPNTPPKVPEQSAAPLQFEIRNGRLWRKLARVEKSLASDAGLIEMHGKLLVFAKSAHDSLSNHREAQELAGEFLRSLGSSVSETQAISLACLLELMAQFIAANEISLSGELTEMQVARLKAIAALAPLYVEQFPAWLRFKPTNTRIRISDDAAKIVAIVAEQFAANAAFKTEALPLELRDDIRTQIVRAARSGIATAMYGAAASLKNLLATVVGGLFSAAFEGTKDGARKGMSALVETSLGKGTLIALAAIVLDLTPNLTSLAGLVPQLFQWLKPALDALQRMIG